MPKLNTLLKRLAQDQKKLRDQNRTLRTQNALLQVRNNTLAIRDAILRNSIIILATHQEKLQSQVVSAYGQCEDHEGHLRNMGLLHDFYNLGISEEDMADILKRILRKKAAMSHPDKPTTNQEENDQFKLLSIAYTLLTNPEKREKYFASNTKESMLMETLLKLLIQYCKQPKPIKKSADSAPSQYTGPHDKIIFTDKF
jgi:hypothetical protein